MTIPTVLQKQKGSKLDSKTESLILLGNYDAPMYRLFHTVRCEPILARDVTIDENVFPGFQMDSDYDTDSGSDCPSLDYSDSESDFSDSCSSDSTSSKETSQLLAELEDLEPETQYTSRPIYSAGSDSEQDDHDQEIDQEQSTRSSSRRHPQNTRSTRSAGPSALKAAAKADTDNPTLKMAMSSPEAPQWNAAIQLELEAIQQRGTWELVPRPPGVRVIPSKLVLKVKRNGDGTVERLKARICASGNRQGEDDYYDTYAPVCDFKTIRTVLAIASLEKAPVHMYDISNAFLYSSMENDPDVYMRQPTGYEDKKHPDYVCKLKRCLYGLKQSGSNWTQLFKKTMLKFDFTCLNYAESAYIKIEDGIWIIVLVYIDDCLCITKSSKIREEFYKKLSKEFDLKDLGQVQKFLGVNISQDAEKNYILSQEYYVLSTIEKFGMGDANTAPTPMDPSAAMALTEKPEPQTPNEKTNFPFRELIGALLYLSTHTRFDIAVAVNILSAHVSDPREIHWIAAKRILRYLRKTSKYALHLSPKSFTAISSKRFRLGR